MIIQRRLFLLGLGAAMAAPAIVKPQNIMSVRLFDPYYTRYLFNYLVDSDEMAIRVDRALHPLIIPTKWPVVLPTHIVHKFIPKGFIESIRPIEGQQKYIEHILTWEEAKTIDVDVRDKHD